MLKNYKKLLYLVIPVAVVLGLAVLVGGVHAQTGVGVIDALLNPIDSLLLGIAWLIYGLVWFGGQLLLGLTVILIWVASYNNFINEPVVNVGWVIIRDLSNMVFIVALLYMAFNMVFGMKGKGGASLLTLIISAGLINFSKVIAGLFIDISQVIMLSFVHGFYNIAGGNLMEAFGLQNMLSLKAITNDAIPATGSQASIVTMIGTIILALIMVYIAIGLVLTIIIVLVGRILQLWGLLIFSPTPWVGKLVPGLSKFTGDWWDKLTKYCTSGPVLAFFLWLTFTAVDLYSKSGLAEPFGTAPLREIDKVGGTTQGQVAGLSQAGSVQHMLSFIVIIGLLYLSLDYANKFGIMTAGFAGKVRKTGHKWTKKVLRSGLETTRIPAYASAAKNLVFERSPFLRRLLTEQGQKEKKAERYAAAKDTVRGAYYRRVLKQPKIAGRFNALERVKTKQADELKENLIKEEGLKYADASELRSLAYSAIDAGDEMRARALMLQMAEKGAYDTDDMVFARFGKKFVKKENASAYGEFKETITDKAREKMGAKADLIVPHRRDLETGRMQDIQFKDSLKFMREDLDRKKLYELLDEVKTNSKRWWNPSDNANENLAGLHYAAAIGGINYDHRLLGQSEKDQNKDTKFRALNTRFSPKQKKERAQAIENMVLQAEKEQLELSKELIGEINNAYQWFNNNGSIKVLDDDSITAGGSGKVKLKTGSGGVATSSDEINARIREKLVGKHAGEMKVSEDQEKVADRLVQKRFRKRFTPTRVVGDVRAKLEEIEQMKKSFAESASDIASLSISDKSNSLRNGDFLSSILSSIGAEDTGIVDASGKQLSFSDVFKDTSLSKSLEGLKNYLTTKDVSFDSIAKKWQNAFTKKDLTDEERTTIDHFFTEILISLRRSVELRRGREHILLRKRMDADAQKNLAIQSGSGVDFNQQHGAVKKQMIHYLTSVVAALQDYHKANQAGLMSMGATGVEVGKKPVTGSVATPGVLDETRYSGAKAGTLNIPVPQRKGLDQSLDKDILTQIQEVQRRIREISANKTTTGGEFEHLNEKTIEGVNKILETISKYYKPE